MNVFHAFENDILQAYGGSTIVSPLSNYHNARFNYTGIVFEDIATAIQYRKATLFQDHNAAYDLLLVKTPFEAEKIEIEKFKRDEWNKIKRYVMLDILFAKFTQNKSMRYWLLNTGNAYLAELSTVDKNGNILSQDAEWGISISTASHEIINWRDWHRYGCNLKGNLLAIVRNLIKAM